MSMGLTKFLCTVVMGLRELPQGSIGYCVWVLRWGYTLKDIREYT